MTGTFSSYGTALSALRYNQVAMDVAGSNVANAGTAGYTRRSVTGQTSGAPVVPAIWSRYEGTGNGVNASPVTRMVDPVLDSRSRAEHGAASFLDTRATALSRVETAIAEPGDSGVAAALTKFKAGWEAVANNPGDPAARTQLLARAETLRSTIALQSNSVSSEWSDQRSRLDALTTETNQVATQLADLNKGLRASNANGTDANALLDQRDQLTQRLAELTGAKTTINPDSTVEVRVGGENLVSGNNAYAVKATGATSLEDSGTDPVVFSVDGNAVRLSSGEVGATQQLLDTDLPDYQNRLDSVVATIVGEVNGQHANGVDLDGTAGGDLFTGTTAATMRVAVTDPRKLAAADPTKGALDNTNARALSTLSLGENSYRSLVTGFGSQVGSASTASTTQSAVVSQIDASRESVSGVNTDEEMVALLAAQRGYEGAARVLTAIDSMLDTLINRTGVR
jgi:flagellar hook-associated protein 1 FlgK